MSNRKIAQKKILERQRLVELESRCINVAKAEGKQFAVDFIAQCNFDINTTFDSGYTLFYYAVIFNNIELVKFLLNEDVKIDPNQLGQMKDYASRKVRRLIEDFCDPESDSDLEKPVTNEARVMPELPKLPETPPLKPIKPRSEPSCSPGTLPINDDEQRRVQREGMMVDIEDKVSYRFFCGELKPSVILESLKEKRIYDVLNEILCSGMNINSIFVEGYPILSCAIVFDEPELVKVLMENGANIEYQHEDSIPPYNLALLCGSRDVLQVIDASQRAKKSTSMFDYLPDHQGLGYPEAGIRSNVMDVFDEIESGDPKRLRSFLKDQNMSVFRVMDKDGLTPLMVAARDSSLEIVEAILSEGGKSTIDVQSDTMKNTAIMFAIIRGHLDIIKRLIRYGASIHIKNAAGKSVIDLASENLRGEDFSVFYEERAVVIKPGYAKCIMDHDDFSC